MAVGFFRYPSPRRAITIPGTEISETLERLGEQHEKSLIIVVLVDQLTPITEGGKVVEGDFELEAQGGGP